MECDNADRGCKWEGTVSTLANHLPNCGFYFIECPNGCENKYGEIEMIMRKYLDWHLNFLCPNRDYMCDHCGKKGTYASITQVHDAKCALKMIPCTNDGCTSQLQRRDMPQHVNYACEHTVIACKHQSIGCAKKIKRKDMAAHEQDDTLHLHMAINTISLLKKQHSILSLVNGVYTTTFKLQQHSNYENMKTKKGQIQTTILPQSKWLPYEYRGMR